MEAAIIHITVPSISVVINGNKSAKMWHKKSIKLL